MLSFYKREISCVNSWEHVNGKLILACTATFQTDWLQRPSPFRAASLVQLVHMNKQKLWIYVSSDERRQSKQWTYLHRLIVCLSQLKPDLHASNVAAVRWSSCAVLCFWPLPPPHQTVQTAREVVHFTLCLPLQTDSLLQLHFPYTLLLNDLPVQPCLPYTLLLTSLPVQVLENLRPAWISLVWMHSASPFTMSLIEYWNDCPYDKSCEQWQCVLARIASYVSVAPLPFVMYSITESLKTKNCS